MRLSWKLFFITTPIFVLTLTLFGLWVIQDNFGSSLDQEIDRCLMENQMFQNSYELTLYSLSEDQKKQASTERIVESFNQKREAALGNSRIYDGSGEVLYQDNELKVENSIREQLDEENNTGYEIVRQPDGVFIVVLARSSYGVLIETTKNITEIFDSRAEMYSRYQIGVLLLSALMGGLILLVLFLVMRNMQKLSRATRRFAMGRYDTRVEIKSGDEIGRLADDFNWMANMMNTQMEQLKDEVRRQEEFTAAFAHELKTPLTSIIGYADTIRQMELTQEETDMCADYIFRQGKRLQSLSYKLLDLTLADRQEIQFREIQVPELLREVERTVRPSLIEKQLTLQTEVQEGVIYGDRDLLGSLFMNLIDNARKASDPGAHIRIIGARLPEGYSICVEDEGRGIPPEELSRITEAFYMVDKSRARKEGGAGLGLALCRKIVELHRAGWQMESAPGEGLRVTVQFTSPDSDGHRRGGRRAEQRRERAALRRERLNLRGRIGGVAGARTAAEDSAGTGNAREM